MVRIFDQNSLKIREIEKSIDKLCEFLNSVAIYASHSRFIEWRYGPNINSKRTMAKRIKASEFTH